jgi:regulator of PEP synthase PpsR (kinase-PPPase family)
MAKASTGRVKPAPCDGDIDMSEVKKIVIISDGTGQTAKRLMDAVLSQYSRRDIDFSLVKIYQRARDRAALDKVMLEVDNESLVIFSIIADDLGRYFHERLTERGILHLNVLEPMLNTMSKFLGVHPDYEPGLLHKIDDRYYQRVDAISYTVEHDDGMGQFIEEAEIVLVGLSRTCKTPISMYLACNHGKKVANIPVVADAAMEKGLLARLSPIKGDIIFGLMMQPEILAHVREERSHFLAKTESTRIAVKEYYNVQNVVEETRYCRQLFARTGWQMIDVTRRAIEEISHEILDILERQAKQGNK